jgi:hypothetical protein
VLPGATTAEILDNEGLPAMSKNTAVKIWDGCVTSWVERLLNVASRFPPASSNLIEALRLPLEPKKIVAPLARLENHVTRNRYPMHFFLNMSISTQILL